MSSYPPVLPPRPGRPRRLKYFRSPDGNRRRGGEIAFRFVVRPKVRKVSGATYRLFEWSELGRTRLVCRACRARIKPESQGRHLATEMARHGTEEALAALLALRSAQRRSRKNLRHARYAYASAPVAGREGD